jgi:hypothetical protein
MASLSSCSVRDRDYQSGAGTVDVDTYQALTVCILAPTLCKSLFWSTGLTKQETQVPIPRMVAPQFGAHEPVSSIADISDPVDPSGGGQPVRRALGFALTGGETSTTNGAGK